MKVIFIRKKYCYLLLALTIILIFIPRFFLSKRAVATISPVNSIKIGIDPGHGGQDPGAIGKSGVKEADINLEIALKLGEIIKSNGGTVVITREKGHALSPNKREDLERRRDIIKRELCDIFISIHLNSFEDSRYYGAQVFYSETSPHNEMLADSIQEELRLLLDKENTREPQLRDDIFLLNEISIPSVLVECGFLSNAQEERLLQSSKYQEKVAKGIYNGIIRFITSLKSNIY